ncbi:MAG: hypothetical protein JXM79_13730 [Sedimentisphaerales bacterium]|nr:hypothetical protein [Sedimentisphaerales bacterium]
MLAKVKISKIAVVLFLTILIWVWTDLALDETYDVSGATIILTESDPRLWISFNGERTIDVNTIWLKGPASKITNIKRKIENHSLSLLFPLDAEKEGLVDSGEPLTVQNLIQKSAQLQDSGLVVESCVPETIDLSVVKLIEKPLAVECYEENGALLGVESIVEPSAVNILVPPENWPPDNWTPGDKAKVVLTRSEVEKAKKTPVQKKAYIQLADGQTRLSNTPVTIRIPPEEQRLKSFDITATIGFCFSDNMMGFKVELLNQSAVIGEPIKIRATSEAKARYEAQEEFKMILYIYDRDEGQEAQSREVHYTFRLEDVRNGDIVLDQTPVTARFRLIPLSSATGP